LDEPTGLRNREHFVNEHLNPLAGAGLIEMAIPDEPRRSRQRYRLTAKGRQFVKTGKARDVEKRG
jgi:predicted transcriptional regulator